MIPRLQYAWRHTLIPSRLPQFDLESIPPNHCPVNQSSPASSGAGEVAIHSGTYGLTATIFSEQVKFWEQKLLVELGSWEKGISITSKARAIFSSCRIPSVPAT
jgi:hypothetical protein